MNSKISLLSGSVMQEGADTFTSTNPARHADVVATFGHASREQVKLACERAHAAFQTWKKVPAPVRAGIIQNWGRLIEANKEALSQLVTREMGKPLREARGVVQEAIDTCNFL